VTSQFSLDPVRDNYAVMGNPVVHSKSPLIHHAFAAQSGEDILYQAILVAENGFPDALQRFQQQGGKGLNITLPFKGAAWQAVDVKSPRAQHARAVNTIWFSATGTRHGDTTDGPGLVTDLINNKVTIRDKRVLVLGAGGAVRSVLSSLFAEQPGRLVISNRSNERAQRLVAQFPEFTGLEVLSLDHLNGEVFDLVINGTSASLSGQMPPLPDTILGAHACCYDMAYGDTDTVFVTWAKQHGAALALDGLGMLVEQAAESFFIWRGVRPDTRPVLEMLRKA
jgi:shikimate dehydrogenase